MLPALLVVLNHVKVFMFELFKGVKFASEAVEPAIREEIFAREQSEGACKEE
jgi:hypothetical protein